MGNAAPTKDAAMKDGKCGANKTEMKKKDGKCGAGKCGAKA